MPDPLGAEMDPVFRRTKQRGIEGLSCTVRGGPVEHVDVSEVNFEDTTTHRL